MARVRLPPWPLLLRSPSRATRVQRHFASQPLPRGVTKEVLKVGEGLAVQHGQNVTVHCVGFGKNGDLSIPFWSTRDPGQRAFTFRVGTGEVIPAWDAGVLTMRVGETASILSDADNAYGREGFPQWGILPNSKLRFEIEVITASRWIDAKNV
jgi:FKBP-type peptidyl-prolyl cis-trans isomerase